MDYEFFTTLAPAGVYLVGLVVALKHIAKLYEARFAEQTQAHNELIAELKAGHEARFALIEQRAKELTEDRAILRQELNQLRERILRQESTEAPSGLSSASRPGRHRGGE